MRLFVDIETIPTQNSFIQSRIEQSIKPPGNIKKADSIDAWMKENYAAEFEKKYRATALDGLYGEILSIAWAIDDSEIYGFIRQDYDTELDVLKYFFNHLTSYFDKHGQRMAVTQWIGHYITGFDLRFIWQRCVINQYEPVIEIPYQAKPWDDCVFDTKIAWTGSSSQYSGASKLGDLCVAFGMDDKLNGMDGSQVYDYWLEDRLDEILAYNKDDVKKTRELYNLMTFGRSINRATTV